MSNFLINGRAIGAGSPTYIIAEMSANHNHDLNRAINIIEAAAAAGADAVKLQTYTADTLTIDSDKSYFRIEGGTLWDGQTLYDLYTKAYTPWEWHAKLQAVARDLGLDCFSTPFDFSAVDFLAQLNVPAYKIASFEMIDLPLVRHIAKQGKPIIMSTGMASLEEIQDAVDAVRSAGNEQLVLLHCTSAYPAPPESMNLYTIPHMAQTFGIHVGLSDHTLGIAVPAAAVALGARVIEKHFILSRADGGPDSAFSLEPPEFKQMVEAVRATEKALGDVQYGPGVAEADSVKFRRSLFVVKDIRAGEIFTEEHIRSIRPGHGLAPKHYDDIIGRKAVRDLERGEPLRWDDIH